MADRLKIPGVIDHGFVGLQVVKWSEILQAVRPPGSKLRQISQMTRVGCAQVAVTRVSPSPKSPVRL